MTTTSLDAALSGMLEQQRKIELIANNIANVNTSGYKRVVVHFQDVLDSAQILAAVEGTLPGNEATTSSGVAINAVERIFAQGQLRSSAGPLDIAIVGEGFFRVRLDGAARAVLEPGGTGSLAAATGTPDRTTPGSYTVDSTSTGAVTVTFTPDDGSPPAVTSGTVVAGEENTTLIPGATLIFAGTLVNGTDTIAVVSLGYARDGAFRLDANRQLVTQLGASIDPPITFPEVFSEVRVQRNGEIIVRRPYTEQELAALGPDDPRGGVDEVVGRIALTRFASPDGLASIGNSLYVATSSSPATDGFPEESGMGFLVGGYLEGSNVDVAEEMTSLMVATRVYQMNLAAYRAIQDMLEQASQLA